MLERPSVVFVDNHDSFTFNLVDAFAALGVSTEVVRNDLPLADIEQIAHEHDARLIVVSPGPGRPADAGCCLDLIRTLSPAYPVLGVCLGHQAIVEAFGGEVGPAPTIVHGKTSRIQHNGHPLFAGLATRMSVGRYHSLVARRVPDALEVIAWDGDLVMAVSHRTLPVFGVQFHPESILTCSGTRILRNLLDIALAYTPARLAPCIPD